MKAQILKIAGVKSEKEFYKKYPSEEAFMKMHGKAFKKAQTGLLQGPSNQSNDYYQNNNPYGIASNPGQTSVNNPAVATPQPQGGGAPFNVMGAMNVVGGIMGGIQSMNAQRKARREAQMWEKVSDVQVKAKASTDALGKPKRMYNRVDDPRNIFSANSYYPAQGVGTNPLAKDGAEIQNTYAPGTLYDDLGYEPLNDPNKVKQFEEGGQEDRAQNFMNNLGQNPYGPLVGSFYGNSGGSQVGGAVGSIFGPAGGAVGSMIGGMFDKDPSDMRSAQRAYGRNMMKLADYEKMFGHTASRRNGGPIAQTGDTIQIRDAQGNLSTLGTSSDKYKELYESGQLQNELADGEENPLWGGQLNEVTVSAKPTELSKLRAAYDEKNSKDEFIKQKQAEYIKGLGSNWYGASENDFPENVLKEIEQNYDYNRNTYALEQLAKKKKFDLGYRDAWVDELSPAEREAMVNSKYSSQLNPNEFAKTLSGVQQLGNTFLPGNPLNIPIAGLTPEEEQAARDSNFSAVDMFALANALGNYIANAAKNSTTSSYGDFRETPMLGSQRMGNVSEEESMALNPLSYEAIASVPQLASSIKTGINTGADFTKKAIPIVKEALPKVGEFAKSTIKEGVETYKDLNNIKTHIKNLPTIAKDTYNEIVTKYKTIPPGTVNNANEADDLIGSAVTKIVNKIGNGLSSDEKWSAFRDYYSYSDKYQNKIYSISTKFGQDSPEYDAVVREFFDNLPSEETAIKNVQKLLNDKKSQKIFGSVEDKEIITDFAKNVLGKNKKDVPDIQLTMDESNTVKAIGELGKFIDVARNNKTGLLKNPEAMAIINKNLSSLDDEVVRKVLGISKQELIDSYRNIVPAGKEAPSPVSKTLTELDLNDVSTAVNPYDEALAAIAQEPSTQRAFDPGNSFVRKVGRNFANTFFEQPRIDYQPYTSSPQSLIGYAKTSHELDNIQQFDAAGNYLGDGTIFKQAGANTTKQLRTALDKVQGAPKGTNFIGSTSLSTDSYPLTLDAGAMMLKKGIVDVNVDTGIQNLNPMGYANEFKGLSLKQINAKIQQLEKLSGKKLPRATVTKQGNYEAPNIYFTRLRQGGNINPQVISQFGNVDAEDFYNYAHEGMGTLRSGGHLKDPMYTPISNRGMETMALGGEVKTTWGGEAKTISQNPYMPGTGETINFYGQSHDESDGNGNTGIGVKYGQGGHDSYTDYAEYGAENPDADVEVERGEPSFEMMDPETGEKNLTVLGNLKFDKKVAAQTGDDEIISLAGKYHGKKFKNIGLDLSKQENKYTKLIEKATNQLDGLDVKNSFDRLTFAANQANIKAGQMGLQKIASDKMTLAHFQNAINEASEENYLVADDLAVGKGTYDKKAEKEAFAKYGTSIKKAQVGVTQPPAYTSKYGIDPWQGNYSASDPYGKAAASSFTAQEWDDIAQRLGFTGKGNEEFQKFLLANPESKKMIDARHMSLYGRPAYLDPNHLGAGWSSLQMMYGGIDPATGQPVDENATYEPIKNTGNKIIPIVNQLLQYVRPSNATGLDAMQTMGESMALADNQEEGVQAQLYYPQLQSNSNVSYQDALNEITAQRREAKRQLGYNPAAQSIVDAKSIDATNKVLAEQFRQNQTRDDATYAANINTMNAAQEKNLGILDNQYVRQQQAKSNTKAVRENALSSISDKYLKNKLENKKLQTYENMYNYRYDANGRLINLNGIYQPTIPQVYGNKAGLKMVKTTDANGNVVYKMVDANGKQVTSKGSKTSSATAAAAPKGKFQKPPMATDFETPSASSIVPRPYTPIEEEEDPYGMVSGKGKNGKKVKSSNGSILRSIKNL